MLRFGCSNNSCPFCPAVGVDRRCITGEDWALGGSCILAAEPTNMPYVLDYLYSEAF